MAQRYYKLLLVKMLTGFLLEKDPLKGDVVTADIGVEVGGVGGGDGGLRGGYGRTEGGVSGGADVGGE